MLPSALPHVHLLMYRAQKLIATYEVLSVTV